MKSDRGYCQQRAEAEIEAACRASHPKAVEAHYLMASHYLDLAHDALPALDAAGRRTIKGLDDGR